MRITSTVFVLLIQTFLYSQFQLINRATGFCLVKLNNHCNDIRWTSGDRLLVQNKNKCLGVQGKTVGSEVNLYDCDETSELQKWECMNETVIALKGQELYIDLTADNTAVLSNKVVPNSHLTISGTSSGACTRTYTELYTIEGNAAGRPCMFPFFYKSNWYSECTAVDSPGNRKWCAVETKYDHELWGYCPTNSKETWNKDPTTGASYQLNTQSALTWDQADASCKQQSASLLSISNPHEQAYISGKEKTPESGFCTAPWIPYNGHCFYLYRNETKKWSDAQKACRKEGGDLVTIRNVEDQSFIISQLGYASTDELWIGLNDRNRERLFVWSDHSPVSYTSWDSREPTVTSEQEDCVLIRGENGNWADRVCDEKHGFICMKTSDSEPSGDEVELNAGCKTGWKRHGSYCYFLGTETKTFHEANDDCKSSNSYLADLGGAEIYSLEHSYLTISFITQGNVQGCVAMATGHSAGLWDMLPCTNKEKYICKHLAEGEALTPAPPTTATPNCTDGWIKMQSRGICYKIFPEASEKRKTWYEARDYCRAIGGDLVSIHSSADLLPRHNQYWIGLSAPDPDTGYVWSDGSPVNFQEWSDGEPNNENNAESCAEMKPNYWEKTLFWSDVHCEKYNNWICQIHAGTAWSQLRISYLFSEYNTTSDGWLEWNGAQYYINKKAMAMEDARMFCRQRHGDLVSINSEAERIFLWKQVSYQNSWIGLSVDLDGTFQWMDGSQLLFQSWQENQPDFKNFDENCAFMTYHNGFWHDSSCGLEYASICKRSSSTPANTTAAVPTVSPKGGCPHPWKKCNSKCYSIIDNQNLTWHDAREKCKQKGGNLVSITSRQVEGLFHFLFTQISISILLPSRLLRSIYDTTTEFLLFSLYHHVSLFSVDPTLFPQKNCFVINTKPLIGIGKWIQKSCNDTNGFICHRNLDTSQPDSPEPTISTNYIKILNDSIKVVPQQMNWDKAAEYCKNDDALLASLRNEWTQAYVELLALNLKAPLWFGLHKINGSFRYVDGWHLIFSRWGKNEPSKDRSCVYMDVDGKWKTTHCNETLMSVCMKSTDVLPTESTLFPGVCPLDPEATIENKNYIWVPFRGYCYIFITEQKRWQEASTSCVAHGGMLASIEDSSEQKFLEINLRTFQDGYTSFWIGLFKKQHKGESLFIFMVNNNNNNNSNIFFDHLFLNQIFKTGLPHHQRVYITTAVVLVITGIAVVAVTAVFFFKKFGHQLPAPNTFDNPLFFSSRVSQPEQADTSILVENAAEENTGDLISM
uniref:Mannose receptor, C type 1b n=1 Tax=Maylandia zebra TaxID=106582 RepID=A0A3P9CYJ1_9CICH